MSRAVPLDVRRLQVLKADEHFQLQRVVTGDGERLAVKFAASAYPTAEEERVLAKELELFETLGSRRTLRPVRLGKLGDRRGAYYRDIEGKPLSDETFTAPLRIAQLATIVRDLCGVLGELHAKNTVLVGLTPGSVLVSSHGQVVLTDAPLAQPMGAQPIHEGWFGTPYLQYVAPEVIARAPLTLDARTDLYALGALLYRLLCKRPPFEGAGPSEIIQSHLARQPRLPVEHDPSIPIDLARIVMRLLAKAPQDRYPSVEAFFHDFTFRVDPAARSSVWEPLEETSRERSTVSFGGKLYGRETATRYLREKVGEPRTAPTLLFLEGEAGIGKSALVRAFRTTLRQRSHQVGAGRFAHGGSVPLSGWVTALRDLANTLLTTHPSDLDAWRTKILGQLGERAALLGHLVPEWNAIFEGSPPAKHDAPEASLERVAMAVRLLLGCFASPESAVVLILDDLQWADPSSLRILELVLTAPDPLNLVILAALRTGDESVNYAFVRGTRDTIVSSNVSVDVLKLKELGRGHIKELLRDSFHGGVRRVEELVDLTVTKTGGSPFFVWELLRALVQRKLLRFDAAERTWIWSEREVASLPVAESLVAFLGGKIHGQPEEVKDALRLAAVLGPEFTLSQFCCVQSLRPQRAMRPLDEAVAQGLLVKCQEAPPGDAEAHGSAREIEASYGFVHDRVYEGCLALMSDDERSALHLQVARAFLRRLEAGCGGSSLFEVVRHFNAGRRYIQAEEELLAVIELELRAGRMAKQRGAFSQALESFDVALELLARLGADDPEQMERAWGEHFELTLAVHEEAGEAALLNNQVALMHQRCDAILQHVFEPLAKVPAYDLRVCGLKAEKKFSAAVDAALDILQQLGVEFPERPGLAHTLLGFWTTRRRLRSVSSKALIDRPVMTDPRMLAVARIIQSVYSAAYLGRPKLFPLLVYRHVNDSLRYGTEDYSGVTYNAFAAVLCAMGEVVPADELGRLGLQLIEKYGVTRHEARASAVYYFLIFPWTNPLTDAIPHYSTAIRAGLEHGDFEFTCYLMTFHSLARLHTGVPLTELREEFALHRDQIMTLGQERSILMQNILCQLAADLVQAPERGALLAGAFYDEPSMLPRCLDPLDENLVFHNHLAKMVLGLFLGDLRTGLAAAEGGRPFLAGAAFGSYLGAIFLFYEAMIALMSPAQRRLRRRIRRTSKKLERWARGAPANFSAKFHLVEAERSRLSGHWQRAAEHFEKAVEQALAHGCLHEAGLAQERAAVSYLERGMDRLGRHYLREARHSYHRWGASAVVRRLEAEFAQHFAFVAAELEGARAVARSHHPSDLDYQALLTSSQAISSEILLPKLLDRLLETIVEHAGAQRALLLLEEKGQLRIEAEIDVDRRATHAGPRAADRQSPGASSVVRDLEGRDLAEQGARLSLGIVRYAARTKDPVVLPDASRDELFAADAYVVSRKPKSVMCAPILHQGRLLGLIYLENNDVSHLFTPARLEMVGLLASQAAISIANARFHAVQMEAQQAKINPHFLFNALSSIADLALTDGETAEQAIIKLAQLYRYILTNSVEELVPLESELEVVRNYLSLEKLRYGSKLDYSVEVEGDLGSVRLPALVIQPIVENSIRHGISGKLDGGRVSVHARVEGGRCWIVVQDDGEGPQPSSSGTGFGLKSVQERLGLVYGDRYSFSIQHGVGCRVEIDLPLPDESSLTARRRQAQAVMPE